MARFAVALILLLTGISAAPVAAAATPDDGAAPPVVVEVFWGDGCGFCERLLDHLDELATRQPGFVVEPHEVWYDRDGLRRLQQRADELGISVEAVPFTVIGERSWTGFSEPIARQIDETIARAVDANRPDAPVGPDLPAGPPAPPIEDGTVVDVPLVGEVDVAGRSLVLSTTLIAFVDGFNPCSLWVLTVLLALVLHTGSRRRVALIGGSFLLVTTVIYGLFLVGVYSALSMVSALTWARLLVAAFALVFGIVNVKDYWWFRVGPSFTIADRHKPGIVARARGLIRPDVGVPAAMFGAAAMAVGVSLVEIPCTAGFPVVWSDQLDAAGVSGTTFAGLLGLYLLVYLMDELLVFGAAVATMRVTKLQERHGRVLKLIGGSVMIAIAVTILVWPHAMDTVSGVLAVFGVALGASAVIALADRLLRGSGHEPPPGATVRSRDGAARPTTG